MSDYDGEEPRGGAVVWAVVAVVLAAALFLVFAVASR